MIDDVSQLETRGDVGMLRSTQQPEGFPRFQLGKSRQQDSKGDFVTRLLTWEKSLIGNCRKLNHQESKIKKS